MKKKIVFVLAVMFLVVGLVTVCQAANNITGQDNICHLSGPNPDCPNPDCPDPDCPDPDCPHNGPKYRGGK